MRKIAIISFLIATTLLVTACESKEVSYNNTIDEKTSSIISENKNSLESETSSKVAKEKLAKESKIIEIPISTISNEVSTTKYIKINENSSLQEKMQVIIDTISKDGFNDLPMNVKVYGKNIAKIQLIEHDSSQKSRVTWKDDYLNEDTIDYTINTIIKNTLQEEYKGEWIEKVQLYYDGELIKLD